MPGPSSITDIVAAHARSAGAPAKGGPAAGLSFADVVDAVNPLQHIPVVSWAYRALTGDGIGGAAKLVGGALFGGPIGLALAAADNVWERARGKDMGGTLVAWAKGNDRSPELPGGIQLAEADQAAALANPFERPLALAAPEKTEDIQTAAAPVTPPAPAWQLAVAQLPQDQVDLLLRSVGLPPPQAGTAPPSPAAEEVPIRMPAVPAAPVGVLALADAQAMPPTYRQADWTAALAANQELRRAYGRP